MTSRTERTRWLMHDRFGMFIHWGLYAIAARGEQVQMNERMTAEAYQTYFEAFNPTRYNPREWARAAKEAGIKYAVLTTKHHDGFCLFDSELTDYKATNTQAGRDLVREFVEACRAEGLAVGFYYSLIDWHHPHYPVVGFHPRIDDEASKAKPVNFDLYLDYMHGQVRELLTNYGKIDIMWFDFSFGDMTGEKWRASELVRMIRTIQPHIVIDNRLGGEIRQREPEEYAGDFYSPEQVIPLEDIVNEDGESIAWEACITLNGHWGYFATDREYKSPKQVVRTLVECVSKNGNLLLNVGPDAMGEIPQESLEILSEVGRWMRRNGDSIYGCGLADRPKPAWGRYTQNGHKLYAHLLDRGIGPIYFEGLKDKVRKARLLADGSELKLLEKHWVAGYYGYSVDGAYINLPNGLPDDADTVIELELAIDS